MIKNFTNQMQLYRSIYYPKSALNTVNTVKCSWWWAKISPETCRADLE